VTGVQMPSGSPAARDARRRYLDWLRGVAVLIMIGAHTFDSWTRVADRTRWEYAWAMILAGFGAPVFLFLAGMALVLAAGSRLRRGLPAADVAATARRRAWQIFGLAFLFRLQSWAISRGPASTLLKVDVLNVMGLAMLAAAIAWGLGRGARSRAVALAGMAVAVAMSTPLVRATPWLSSLPEPVEWYFRSIPGRTTFTLFPWAGFLLGGAAIGVWLDAARTVDAERRTNIALAATGAAIAIGGYGASFLPPIYHDSSFWTSSPTFFFLRLGILIAAIPIAYAWNAVWKGRSPLQEFGLASFFVYWIHVEMVYGVASVAIHRRLTLEQVTLAAVAFTIFLFALVKVKDRVVRAYRGWQGPSRRARLYAAPGGP
jgi:uncharacterized membrane protein